jgi:hypothetical protein
MKSLQLTVSLSNTLKQAVSPLETLYIFGLDFERLALRNISVKESRPAIF